MFTLGVEEELQLVDPATRELAPAAERVAALADARLAPKLREEVHQGVVEIVTDVCADVAAVRAELVANRIAITGLARRAGVEIAAAGAHPFTDWRAQQFTDAPRFDWIARELGGPAPGLACFGLHVHVGVPDPDEAIGILNRVRSYLPHLLALTTSSPLWGGRPSGNKSVRAELRRMLPRTGTPDVFADHAAYRAHIDALLSTRCIDVERRLWWDLRRSPSYDTIEFRISDMPTRLGDVVAVVALVQALVARASAAHRAREPFVAEPSAFVEENRRRAVRHGVRCRVADFAGRREVPFVEALDELVELASPFAAELGALRELERVRAIAREGTSAEGQLAVWETTGDARAVVDWLVRETQRDVPSVPTPEIP